MIYSFLYRIGSFIALRLPRRVVYCLSDLIAEAYCQFSRKDRTSVINNLKVILGPDLPSAEYESLAAEVFKNFARYLVDFFRFSKLDRAFIERYVTIEGEEFLKRAKAAGKGAILLSAHIGNWELGGAATSLIGYPLHAVALTHSNKEVNKFFIRQRSFGGLNVISIGPSLKRCFSILKNNGFLALLGDRDFSENGIRINFFGRPTKIPKGPAMFSLKTGAMLLPVFMIREKGDRFRLVFKEPIIAREAEHGHRGIEALVSKYLTVIEDYVRRYPTQWFMFREVWNEGANSGPDTIV